MSQFDVVIAVAPATEDDLTDPKPTRKKKQHAATSDAATEPRDASTAVPEPSGVGLDHCEHFPYFVSRAEADEVYVAVVSFPWTDEVDQSACYFGKPYFSKERQEKNYPVHEIPSILLPFAERIAAAGQAPVNYIQCHKLTPDQVVRPHKDPAGMIVPMLTLGQARTFRVGGTMPQGYYRMLQAQRQVSKHVPAKEILMNHGDLLIFTGGHVLHSMFPAKDDTGFNPSAYDCRYSILFRWTTDAIREHGRGKAAREAGHDQEYKEAVENYRNGLTDFLGRKVKP
jgi:hypothetical protein